MRNIFFIVGTGRSGTNLCQQLLDLHPGIKAVTETHFIRTLVRHFPDVQLSPSEFFEVIADHFMSDGQKRWVDFHIEKCRVSSRLFKTTFIKNAEKAGAKTSAELVKVFFQTCYGNGDYLLGDKTPFYGLHAPEMLKLFPNAKFIHLSLIHI